MARVHEIYIGARFGRLTVIGERTRDRPSRVPVRCDCGNESTPHVHALGVSTRSCGCFAVDVRTSHGLSDSAEYKAWQEMNRRCTSPKHRDWARYGGRGIAVCAAWRDEFPAFYQSVGPRPSPEHSLDRIDNDGNYEPGNVRWATRSQQMSNQARHFICRRGHRLEGENLRVSPSGERRCRACERLRQERRTTERRARRQTGSQP